jgi:hypothetical protein
VITKETNILHGNPEPMQMNTSTIVNCRVQRLSVEEEVTNKTLKDSILVNAIPNDSFPYHTVEKDIVRHLSKDKKTDRQLPVIAALLPLRKMAA